MPRWWQLKYFVMFTPNFGEDVRFDEHIFPDGLVETTNQIGFCFFSWNSVESWGL